MGRLHVLCTLVLLILGLTPGSPAEAADKSEPQKVGHVTVQAFADRAAVVPGGTLELAVRLTLDKDWYVYWQNPGGFAGLPTIVEWSTPSGLDFGRVRYPTPEEKYDKELGESTIVLKHDPILLTTVRVPEALMADKGVTLIAKVSWLACEKSCIPGNAEVRFTLPVAAMGDTPKPANKDVFDAARAAMPEPIAKAEHVKLSGSVSKDNIAPGDTFTAKLVAEIAAGHHMQSSKPLQDGLIPARVFVERVDGFTIDAVKYPEAHTREDRTLGKLSEYEGKIEFEIPITFDEDAKPAPRTLRGVVQYQICSEKGVCFRPQMIEFEIPVSIAGAAASGEQPVSKTAGEAGTAAAQSSAAASDAATPPEGTLARIEKWFLGFGYFGALALALVGGIILNLMPCVLPVISLKILSFVRQAKEDRARILFLGLMYCLGLMVFFTLIGVLFALTGAGWGQHFQNPNVILILAAVITAFAMSLFGVFAVFTPKVFNELGQKAEEREGPLSAFFTGVLATILGTACTAPGLSAAVGVATKFTSTQGAFIFVTVGIGMALPFLILSAKPGWLKFVPKPGPWMGNFEKLMGFLLLGTVIWLMFPLGGQLGVIGMLAALIFMLCVAIAVWIKGMVQFGDPMKRKAIFNGVALGIVVVSWVFLFEIWKPIDKLQAAEEERKILVAKGMKADQPETGLREIKWRDNEIPWEHYVRDEMLKDVARGHTVFVDYTADWCVNCKTNLSTSIDVDAVKKLMRDNKVVPYEADYTSPNAQIKEDLKHFGKAGVPLYLVYSPGDPDNPQILPEVLTPQIVLDALNKAGPSRDLRAGENHAGQTP